MLLSHDFKSDNILLLPYSFDKRQDWENFLGNNPRNADFMFSRKFLEYHGERFIDRSLIFYHKDQVIAIFSAGSTVDNISSVTSHIGASYGGFVYDPRYGGIKLVEMATAAIAYYRSIGIEKLFIKPKPHIYSDPAGSEDLYAWWRNGAIIERVDISNLIEVCRFELGSRRKRSLKKIPAERYEVREGFSELAAAYEVCAETLVRRHAVQPVHSIEEMFYLSKVIPKHIRVTTGYLDGQLTAGLILFINNNAAVVQYWGSTEVGREINSLDPLVIDAIQWCADKNLTWFVPGVSTSKAGQQVDTGIYEYKVSLGSGAISIPLLRINL
jgi:hypothetical protein